MMADPPELDFHVIYNSSSSCEKSEDEKLSLVFTKYLVEFLEDQELKGYYDDRNAVPSRNIFTELERLVYNSRKTIVIISPGFQENCWASYCQRTTFKRLLDKEHSDKFIPISLNLRPEQLPGEVNIKDVLMFKDTTYMCNTAKEIWKRLLTVRGRVELVYSF